MATVRKCDICGNIYTQYPEATETIMMISTIKKNDKFSTVYGENEIDCCPKCTDNILSFIDVLKTYPTRYCVQVLDEEP